MTNANHLAGEVVPTQLNSGTGFATTLRENSAPQLPVEGIRVVVPELLRERYQITKQFPTQGADADILLAEDVQLQRQAILKLCRPGIAPKTDVLESQP